MSISGNPIVAERVVCPINGTAANPSISFGGSAINNSGHGFYLKSAAVIALSISGTEVMNWSASGPSEVGSLALADGTVLLPSLSFSSDATTGLFYDGSNGLKVATNGVLALTLSSAQLATFAGVIQTNATSNQLVIKPGANTFTITAANPAASRVLTIPDSGGDSSFVMNAGAQSIAGVKTFSALPVFSVGIATSRVNVASTATIASLASTNSYVKLTGSTATDLQGIAAGVNGQRLVLANLTGQNLTIRNQSASAASGAKITTMTGADVVTTANGAAEFIYDTDASPAEWTCLWVTA